MAQAGNAWELFGRSFLLAMEETGKALAETTHEGFQWLADATKPEAEKALEPEYIPPKKDR